MIFNTYGVLDAFVVLLRLLFGLLVLGFSAVSLKRQRAVKLSDRQEHENRFYFLFLSAIVLLGLNVASWPLFYLLLQSYVPQWPGVMCIYGVTQVGSGSEGLSRYLPNLVATLQVTKPLLVFCSGVWLALYVLNRRTQTGPLLPQLFGTLLILGLLATADAVVEAAYLIIPKREEFLSVGCCTEAFDAAGRASRFLPTAFFGEDYHPGLYVAYFGIHLVMISAMTWYTSRTALALSFKALVALSLGALVSIPISALFLIEIAAPRILQLPYHHCPYDLLPQAPESVVTIGLFALGAFSVGWAACLGSLGQNAETAPFLEQTIKRILAIGLFGYLASALMMSLQLVLVSNVFT